MVDASLYEKRNRKARSVFHYDDDRQEHDRPPVGLQQRAEQCACLTPARQRLIDRQVVVALLVEPAAPRIDRLLGIVRGVDMAGVGSGHRPSASVVAYSRSRASHARSVASCSR